MRTITTLAGQVLVCAYRILHASLHRADWWQQGQLDVYHVATADLKANAREIQQIAQQLLDQLGDEPDSR